MASARAELVRHIRDGAGSGRAASVIENAIAVIQHGWNPIWFGVVVVSLMEVAAVTPPVGLNLYAVKASVPSISLKTIYVGSIQFWLINILLILVLFAFPEIALILPNMQ